MRPLNTARPFFRQESVIRGTRDEGNPWQERMTYEDPSGAIPVQVKETVLQNKWHEKIPLPTEDCLSSGISDGNVDMIHDVDEHYQLIDECKMISNFELKRLECSKATDKTMIRSRLPPPPLRPTIQDGTGVNNAAMSLQREDIAYNKSSNEEERSQCLEYREMVNIFKPLIVQNLLVQDILPSLPFLENHDDIYESMKNHSPKMAVIRLLDELSQSEELGKWQKFIDALSANGYTYIVDNIRGYKFVNHEYQKEYIKKLTPKIGKMIIMRELLPHVVALDLISESDKENIEREDTNRGNYAATVMFLGRVHKKHRYWYPLLIQALEDANMEDVAADLKIPNLLTTDRRKVSDVYDDNTADYQLPPCPRSDLDVSNESKMNMEYDKDNNIAYKQKKREHITAKNQCEYIKESYLDVTPDLPPRIPIPTVNDIRKKRKVPVPIWTNDDYEMFMEEQIKLRQIQPIISEEIYDDDDSYEKYDETFLNKITASVKTEDVLQKELDDKQPAIECVCSLQKKNILTDATFIDSMKLTTLRNEIEDTKAELDESYAEAELLGDKSSLNDKLIESIRRVNKLKKENALKKKELQALRIEEDHNEEEENTLQNFEEKVEEHYPSSVEVRTYEEDEITALKAFGSRTKQTVDLRGITVIEKCHSFGNFLPVSMQSQKPVIQIYSPNFKARQSISNLFEHD